jgi:hypothetical protein
MLLFTSKWLLLLKLPLSIITIVKNWALKAIDTIKM